MEGVLLLVGSSIKGLHHKQGRCFELNKQSGWHTSMYWRVAWSVAPSEGEHYVRQHTHDRVRPMPGADRDATGPASGLAHGIFLPTTAAFPPPTSTTAEAAAVAAALTAAGVAEAVAAL